MSHSGSAPNRFFSRHRRAVRRTATFLIAVGAIVCATVGVLSAAGDLDPTFNGTGKVTTPIGTGNEVASAIAIQPDGKIIAAGDTFGATRDFALARYNVNGSLDSSFDGDGKVTTDFNNSFDTGNAVALQSDSKIIVAGNSLGTSPDFALVRYLANGALDTSFGGSGKVTTNFSGASSDTAYAVAIQADGKIVAAGITDSSAGSHTSLALARYNSDGSVDTSFGTGGWVTTTFDNSINIASAVVIQSDGKIVAAGSSYSSSIGNFAVARFNPNGSLDTTFDGDGKVTTDINSTFDRAYDVAIQTDGKLVVVGSANTRFALARYHPNGSLDTSFGGTGKVTTNFLGIEDIAFGVAVQANGKIVAAGYASSGPSYSFALARYSSIGALDLSFGSSGKVMFDFGNSAQAHDVAIQADGKIVASGNAYNGANIDFALARLLSEEGTIIINSTSDEANGADGFCTLREAIQAANSNTTSGMVAGECAAGSSTDSDTITFTIAGTIGLTSPLPNISSNMTIRGPGANVLTVRRSTAGGIAEFRIFTTTAGLTTAISELSISDGRVTGGNDGGAIFNQNGTSLTLKNVNLIGNATGDASSFRAGFGGAVFNRGTLNLINSTVSGNLTGKGFFGGSGKGGNGGGIYNDAIGVLNVINSTISGNATGNGAFTGSPSNSDGDGGGIYNAGTATVINSTISNNTTSTGNSGTFGGRGAGINSAIGSTLTLRNCTIVGNVASNGVGGSIGGGLSGGGTVSNSIFASNRAANGPDTNGFNSQDYNLIGDTSGGTVTGTTTHNLVNVNPNLGPLANNGGPTQTMLPLPGSPVINAGNPSNLPPDTFDLNNNGNTTEPLPLEQRGFERVAETNFDIGAVETNYSAPVLFVEDGSNRLAALDSVTFVRGPFTVLSEVNFSTDKHTRILFFTSNLGMTQPDISILTVEAGGLPLVVEAVGPQPNNSGLDISYVIVKLADGLPVGNIPLTVTLRGARSFSGIIEIAP